MIITSINVSAQISILSDKVLPSYLYNGKIIISPTQNSITVKFNADFRTTLDAAGNPNPGQTVPTGTTRLI